MEIAKIRVSGVRARAVCQKTIPAGLVGATVSLEYTDPIWDGLSKTVVFSGCTTKDVLDAGTVVKVPPEVVAKPGVVLQIGVYGVDAANNLVIPTLWESLGYVHPAADPSGDPDVDESLPVWAQLQAAIGKLDDLETEAKNNLVAAINELAARAGGEVDPAEVQRLVEEYLAENPPEGAVRYTPQTLTEEQKEQARDNIGFGEDDALSIVAEMGLVEPVTDGDGAILTDENGAILVI